MLLGAELIVTTPDVRQQPSRRALWEPCTVPGDVARGGVVPVSAAGTKVTYSDGSVRTCMNSGLWNVPFGYSHPDMLESVREATAKASYLQIPSQYSVDAADLIAETLGGQYRAVTFSTSGGAAVDTAMKLCRLYGSAVGGPGKRVIIGLTESYHGLLYGSFGLTGEDVDQGSYGLDRRFIRHIAVNDTAALGSLLDQHGPDICGMFVEPVQGNNGEAMTGEFVELAASAAREFDFLLVADEVTTGIYRTGPFVASSGWPAEPDVVILSKGLTNGMAAASVVAVGRRAVDALSSRNLRLIHMETQAGTPASCAAIMAALRVGQQLHDDGAVTRTALAVRQVLTEVAGKVGSLRAHGVGCLQFLSPVGDRGPLSEAGPDTVLERLYDAGVLCHPTLRGIAVVPSFVCSEADRDVLRTALMTALG